MSTAEEILAQLDHAAAGFNFPALDNGYTYPGDVRLSIFRDHKHWLMIIEDLGAHPRAGGIDSIQNCLSLYGDNLQRLPGRANEDFLFPIEIIPDCPLFDDKYDFYVRDDATCVAIRSEIVKIDISPSALKRRGIELACNQQPGAEILLRSLLPEYRQALLASDGWGACFQSHPDGAIHLFASKVAIFHDFVWRDPQCETFQMLARAIATGDKGKYSPTKAPNTHWKNWPEGGTL